MMTSTVAEDALGRGAGGAEAGPRERFAMPGNRGQGGRRLAFVVMLMGALACMLWLAYHLMRANARAEPPVPPEPAVSAVSTLRLPSLPPAVPVKEPPKEDKYEQLMAYLNDRFAAYDRLLNRPPPAVPKPPDLASVIYVNGVAHNTAGSTSTPSDDPAGSGLAGPGAEIVRSRSGGEGVPDIQGAILAAAQRGTPLPQSNRGVDDMLKPSVLQGEPAAKMSNRSYLLAQGTSLECILETAIDTTVPGLTTCILSRDIYSDNSRVLLLEKGSKLVGEYRGSLHNGDERLFLIWSRIVTPLGVAIRVNSPGTDMLGRAGVDGYIDNRYFERFGTALLVSILADAVPPVVEAASDKALRASGLGDGGGGNGGSGNGSATQSAGNQMGSEIIRQGAIVPPVLRKNQGDKVSILVSRDLDFSSIYALALTR